MQTVEQVRQQGYSVEAAPRAVGCTQVQGPHPFWFFNPRFVDDAAGLADSLREASSLGDGQYGFLMAGQYADKDVVPFVLLTEAQAQQVREAHATYCQAKAERDAALARVATTGEALAALMNSFL